MNDGQPVDGGDELQLLDHIDRGVLHDVHVGGQRIGPGDVDRVAVRLGPRGIFGGDVAVRADAIFHDDGAVE